MNRRQNRFSTKNRTVPGPRSRSYPQLALKANRYVIGRNNNCYFQAPCINVQVLSLGGARAQIFCKGYLVYLLQEFHVKPVQLTSSQEEINQNLVLSDEENSDLSRRKRETSNNYGGRLRGQTQSQYLSFGGSQEPGKAEAEASLGLSKVVVSKLVQFDCIRR